MTLFDKNEASDLSPKERMVRTLSFKLSWMPGNPDGNGEIEK